jgi:hypothetical protein
MPTPHHPPDDPDGNRPITNGLDMGSRDK